MTERCNTITNNRVLVFDYGGVLSNHHQDPAEGYLAKLLGVNRDTLRLLCSEKSEHGAAFREDRISENDFWDQVFKLADNSIENRPPNELLSRLWAETYAINKGFLEVLHKFRKSLPIGILTNIDRARSNYLLDVVGILNMIDIYLPSYQFMAIKPKPELWMKATVKIHETLGRNVQIIYVDDREGHVNACRSFGWEGVWYQNVEKLQIDLKNQYLIES